MRFHGVDIRGKFWLPDEEDHSTVPHNGKVDEGRMFYDITKDAVYYGDDTDWILITRKEDVLTDGSKVLMGTYPLPTYWNIDMQSNDLVPLLTSTEAYAGIYGGSWTISGISSTGSHNHGGSTGVANSPIVLGGSTLYGYVSGYEHTHTIQADGLHTHTFDGSWRPAYKKFLVVRYDVS